VPQDLCMCITLRALINGNVGVQSRLSLIFVASRTAVVASMLRHHYNIHACSQSRTSVDQLSWSRAFALYKYFQYDCACGSGVKTSEINICGLWRITWYKLDQKELKVSHHASYFWFLSDVNAQQAFIWRQCESR